ncbi:MAG: site-specific integrase [Defluviicoccus sp.]|nr:site-specific integrase [Defluviicoccus sp.]MDE0275120.1 site-specific integrase [Defluviicoccus sp.]
MTGRKKMRLTDAGIAKLKPSKTEYIVRDSRTAGLGVRVRPSGHRSFVWHGQVDGQVVRKTVGPAALMSVEAARRKCIALQNGAEHADTEAGKGGSDIPLFRDFALGEWRAASRDRMGASRRRFVDRMLNKQFLPAFGALRLDRIRRRDVERWFDAYSRTAPGGANLALLLLRQILNAAVATGLIAANPAQGVQKNARPKFTRFLSAEEIDRLHRALDELVDERPFWHQQADIVRLLLLTGCRKGEIVGLKWSEVDGDELRLADAKAGPRTVWLSGAARTVLDRQPRVGSRYVFPSPVDPARPRSPGLKLWPRARARTGIEDVRLHDLRHTVASQVVARGVALSTVAKMLGHANPTMTLRYAHVGDRDIEAAAERIGKTIARAMETGLTVDRP